MAKKSKRVQDRFRLNEPPAQIPGGMRRKSVLVPRKEMPQIARRERVNRLLLRHDLEKPIARWSEEDLKLLPLIAMEGAVTHQVPAIRYHAILLLSRYPSTENLNLLYDLARRGEDFYVRSYALLALGRTGLKVTATVLRDGLAAPDALERTASSRALLTLAQAVGIGILHDLASREPHHEIAQQLTQLATDLSASKSKEPHRRKVSAAANVEPLD